MAEQPKETGEENEDDTSASPSADDARTDAAGAKGSEQDAASAEDDAAAQDAKDAESGADDASDDVADDADVDDAATDADAKGEGSAEASDKDFEDKKDAAARKDDKKKAADKARRRRERARGAKASKSAAAKRRRERERRAKRTGGNKDRRNIWLLVITTIIVIASVVMFTPPDQKINQGLDIQGGLSVVLSAQTTDGSDVTTEDMEKSRAIIESRVNALGASEATVQTQGNNQILVQIPGLSDTQTALSTIGKTGKLEFARADSFTNADDQQAIENGSYASQKTVTDDFGNSFQTGQTTHRKVTEGTYTPLITGSNITKVSISKASETSQYYSVDVTLDSAGTQAFAAATKDLAPTNGKIVIILDGEIQSAPAVQSEITGGNVSITGNYTLEEAQALQTVLESGSLPVSFQYEQSQVVGPTLGQDALTSGLMVAILGLALIMIYLLVFYHGLGLLTAAAMGVFAVLYLGLLATLSAFGLFSLSLAGIAGIVLTIGMAADSSILVLERFREEIRMGRSVRAASITGVRHGIETSIDADLVTLVSALTLFFLASASVKGFGMTLALGIFCDILMMLLLKAPLIRLLAPHSIAHHPGFWGIKDSQEAAGVYAELTGNDRSPQAHAEDEASGVKKSFTHKTLDELKGRFIRHDINFMGVRKVLLSLSAVLVVLSFVVVGVRGLQFGIEFVGGTSIAFHDTGDVTIDQMRTAFSDAGEPDAVVQTTNADGAEGYLIRTTDTSAEDAAAKATKVVNELGLSTDSFEVNTVGPDWGQSVIQSSLIAFFVSLLLIIAYIAIRFEYKMGIMAVVALLHDLIIVVGVYALVGREVNPNTIAALLTILGYSLYDTVVVFHRITDNMKLATVKSTFMSMANHSINQVFIRSINTTLTSFVPVLGMLLFGGETLKDFAFAMAVGLIAGSYSSIAVATPLFAMWKTREPQNAKLQRKFGSAVQLFTFASTPYPVPELPTASAEEGAKASADAAQTKAAGAAASKRKTNRSKGKRKR